MAAHIIDRRVNGKHKSSSNRQRFMRRVARHISESIKDSIKKGSVRDIIDEQEQSVVVPKKDIGEPWFHHARGSGDVERVYPGNEEYVTGDRIPKPDEDGPGAGGVGDGASEDDFQFMISKKEYLDIFFEDLELPDLVKRQLSTIDETKRHRAGYSIDGVPSRLNYIRSLKQSIGRRAALRNPKKRKLEELEALLEELLIDVNAHSVLEDEIGISQPNNLLDLIEQIKLEIAFLKRKIKAIPFIDTLDLRYNRFEIINLPVTRAAMFMVMDVSGSMDEFKKEMAKRFYMLLYIFLSRTYEHIDIIPIRYHTEAKEVSEQEFFYSQESGGTLLSPALKLSRDIMKERYADNWNIYFCHASDGDNSDSDTSGCVSILNEILPKIQYYAFIQIGAEVNTLSQMYDDHIIFDYDNVDIAFIDGPEDIFPVFRKLFEKEQD